MQKVSLDDLNVPLASKKIHVFALIYDSWGCSLWVQFGRDGDCFKLKYCC